MNIEVSSALGLLPYAVVVVFVIWALFNYSLVLRLFGVVLIPEDSIGLVNKKFVLFGSNKTLPDGAIIALKGEAGWQVDPLPPGFHPWYWPWQFEITKTLFTRIPENCVGVVQSRAGVPIPAGRVFAKRVECDAFQDARHFFESGGERGPQITVIPPGTYRIHTEIFAIKAEAVIDIDDSTVGIVTTKEGAPLPEGEIAGPTVPNHNAFQDGQAFLDGGGCKGRQSQVLLAGRYFMNPDFVSVEPQPMTLVPIAQVGVVIAYVGKEGKDLTGESFKYGNLVSRGEKGVWAEPLDPGKYPINTYTHDVEHVPTANVVLNWATGKNESHKLDENLSTITVRSSDGFTFNLDVSQIIHIPRNDAPKVIARFGSMKNLVTQVLEPTIGNYFRNAAQSYDVISFLTSRQERQQEARASIEKALEQYNVFAVDTLIGDITPPPDLMKILTDKKIASQQKLTFETQKEAQVERQRYEQAKVMADTQTTVVTAERQVAIQEFTASALVKSAEGAAAARRITADAEAYSTKTVGDADASKTLAVGGAEATVIKQKIESMESGNYASIEVSKALAAAGVNLVPNIVVNGSGSGDGANNGLVGLLLASLVEKQSKA